MVEKVTSFELILFFKHSILNFLLICCPISALSSWDHFGTSSPASQRHLGRHWKRSQVGSEGLESCKGLGLDWQLQKPIWSFPEETRSQNPLHQISERRQRFEHTRTAKTKTTFYQVWVQWSRRTNCLQARFYWIQKVSSSLHQREGRNISILCSWHSYRQSSWRSVCH